MVREIFRTIGYFLLILVIVAGIFCGIWLYDKFTAKSYDYGSIKETSSNLVFYIDSPTVVLTDIGNGEYGIERKFSSVYQLDNTFDADKYNYIFELNDNMFPNTNIYAGRVECVLDLTFLDTAGNDIMTDTLYLTINFYNDSSELVLKTKKVGSLNYWNSYFNGYGFKLKVYKGDLKTIG